MVKYRSIIFADDRCEGTHRPWLVRFLDSRMPKKDLINILNVLNKMRIVTTIILQTERD